MIIFISSGRLGNQLFQYAFLRTIARENETIAVANMKQFFNSMDYSYKKLQHFDKGRCTFFLIRRLGIPCVLHCLATLRVISFVRQKVDKMDLKLPECEKRKGLLPITFVKTNYYQTEQLFDSVKIDFRIKKEYLDKAQAFMTTLPKQARHIFVHVRRGDYVLFSVRGKRGVELPQRYYEKAMEELSRGISNSHFIFLTDDFDYVNNCFGEMSNKTISTNDMTTDLAIMTLCEYGVISNSSFSWWGAYLMKNRKKVISPKYWLGWRERVEIPQGIQPKWARAIEIMI